MKDWGKLVKQVSDKFVQDYKELEAEFYLLFNGEIFYTMVLYLINHDKNPVDHMCHRLMTSQVLFSLWSQSGFETNLKTHISSVSRKEFYVFLSVISILCLFKLII